MKPTSTFKLSKKTKTMLSFIVDKQKRDLFKRMMIDAQLEAETKPKKDD